MKLSFQANDVISGVGFPDLVLPPESSLQSDDAVRRQVWGVLTATYPQGRFAERRMEQRYPYPHLFYLTPVAADQALPKEESVVVVGKALSERGLSFFFHQPLAQRRMIASLETSEKRWAGFLIDITWCRFTQYGWYESGGRFIQAVPSPIARPVH